MSKKDNFTPNGQVETKPGNMQRDNKAQVPTMKNPPPPKKKS